MLLETVRAHIDEHRLLPEGTGVVVGLSGGVDSVVLTHLLRRLGYRVVAAHVNYGLRGAASDGDEAFVRRWCASLDPPISLRRTDCDVKAETEGASVQEAARDARYAFFGRVAREEGVPHVAVGHHRDDQAETLLLNLFRGSGIEGLAGMPARRRLDEGSACWLVRPLLTVRRSAIETYARQHELSWRTDPSNRRLTYRRSALRAFVVPAIEKHFEGATGRIARTAELMQGYVEEVVRPALNERFARCAAAEQEGGSLHLETLREQPAFWQERLLLEALRRWLPGAPRSRATAEELRGLLDAQVGRRVRFRAGTVWRERERLRLVPGPDEAPDQKHVRTVEPGRPAALAGGRLRIDMIGAPPGDLDAGGPNTALLDADRLIFPLQARPWQDGDRFHPLGLDGTKTVSDLLTDEKVPPHRRKGVWVLVSDETIVWVMGYRLAETAKVRPATRQVARVVFDPSE